MQPENELCQLLDHPFATRTIWPVDHPLAGDEKDKISIDANTLCRCCFRPFLTSHPGSQCYAKPLAYDDAKDKFTVTGVFCSLSCVKRSIIDDMEVSDERLNWLTLMAIRVYRETENIIATPALDLFENSGGKLNWKIWFENKACRPIMFLRSSPFILSRSFIEESVMPPSVSLAAGSSSSSSSSSGTGNNKENNLPNPIEGTDHLSVTPVAPTVKRGRPRKKVESTSTLEKPRGAKRRRIQQHNPTELLDQGTAGIQMTSFC